MLKKPGERLTIWERNFQLALYSSLLLLGLILMEYLNTNSSNNRWIIFHGWTINAIIVSIISATGGLLVAATLKYADSILKTLSTSVSIIISTYVGYYFLGSPLDIFVSIGKHYYYYYYYYYYY